MKQFDFWSVKQYHNQSKIITETLTKFEGHPIRIEGVINGSISRSHWSALPVGDPSSTVKTLSEAKNQPTATATIREEHSTGTNEDHHKTSYNHTTTS